MINFRRKLKCENVAQSSWKEKWTPEANRWSETCSISQKKTGHKASLCCLWHSLNIQKKGSALWTSTWQRWLSSSVPGKSLKTTTTNKYILRTFCVPGAVLGTGRTAEQRTKTPALREHIFNSSFGWGSHYEWFSWLNKWENCFVRQVLPA